MQPHEHPHAQPHTPLYNMFEQHAFGGLNPLHAALDTNNVGLDNGNHHTISSTRVLISVGAEGTTRTITQGTAVVDITTSTTYITPPTLYLCVAGLQTLSINVMGNVIVYFSGACDNLIIHAQAESYLCINLISKSLVINITHEDVNTTFYRCAQPTTCVINGQANVLYLDGFLPPLKISGDFKTTMITPTSHPPE